MAGEENDQLMGLAEVVAAGSDRHWLFGKGPPSRNSLISPPRAEAAVKALAAAAKNNNQPTGGMGSWGTRATMEREGFCSAT